MEAREGRNFVGERWQPSERAGRFVLRPAEDPETPLGSWPRSDERELERVLAAWERPAQPWPEVARDELLSRAAGRLAGDEEAHAACTARLGLLPEEWGAERERLAAASRAPLGASARPTEGSEDGAVAVVEAWWGELLAGLLRRVARELAEGRRVLLLADPHLAPAADAVARALLAEGLPQGRLALLHGAVPTLAPLALERSRARVLSAVGDGPRIALLRRVAARLGTRVQRLSTPRARARELAPGEDPQEAAREVVRAAFGRAATLSGQLDGQLGRVFCPERDFSRFSAALLEALEASEDVARPLCFVTEEGAAAAQRARTLGLDEGATLIFGADARAEGFPTRAHAAVLTNVEPAMESSRRPEPAPVLCLARTR